MRKIWVKLALVLMLVSASGILISTLLSIKEMDYHFSFYLEEISEKHNQEIVSIVRDSYQQSGWDHSFYAKLEAVASVLELEIILYDKNHQLVKKVGANRTATINDYIDTKEIPVAMQNQNVGFVTIRHFTDPSDTSLEQHFQLAHTNAMEWTVVVLLVLVSGVSIILARRIVKPIVHMSHAAVTVTNGNLAVRVPMPQGEDELTELVQKFNQLVANLERQEELRKRLTSDIAHELRTPLNTLLAQTEGMIDGVWEATPEHLESTRSEVLRLIRLVNDLDQVIQTEAGGMHTSKELLNVSDVAKEVIDAMSASFQRKEITLTHQLQESAWVLGDKQRLAQVFSNILTNSLKHTQPDGQVFILVASEPSTVIVKIMDNGIGIPSEDLPHVFERFYRGDRSRNRERGGSGLGLTIVKGILEAHQGDIKIESEVGKGTTVVIRIPSEDTRFQTR